MSRTLPPVTMIVVRLAVAVLLACAVAPATAQPTQAAEAARMTRTMLRALRAMPETEQTAPKPPPIDVVTEPPPPEVPRAPILAAALAANVHLWGPASDVIPVAALAAIWRPSAPG